MSEFKAITKPSESTKIKTIDKLVKILKLDSAITWRSPSDEPAVNAGYLVKQSDIE